MSHVSGTAQDCPSPQETQSLVREKDKSVMLQDSAVRAVRVPEVLVDKRRSRQVLGGPGGVRCGDLHAASRGEAGCRLGLKEAQELSWHQIRQGRAF